MQRTRIQYLRLRLPLKSKEEFDVGGPLPPMCAALSSSRAFVNFQHVRVLPNAIPGLLEYRYSIGRPYLSSRSRRCVEGNRDKRTENSSMRLSHELNVPPHTYCTDDA